MAEETAPATEEKKPSLWNGLKNMVTGWNLMDNSISEANAKSGAGVNEANAAIYQGAADAKDAVVESASNAWEATKEKASGAYHAVADPVVNKANSIKEELTVAAIEGKQRAGEAVDLVKHNVAEAAGNAKDSIVAATNAVVDPIAKPIADGINAVTGQTAELAQAEQDLEKTKDKLKIAKLEKKVEELAANSANHGDAHENGKTEHAVEHHGKKDHDANVVQVSTAQHKASAAPDPLNLDGNSVAASGDIKHNGKLEQNDKDVVKLKAALETLGYNNVGSSEVFNQATYDAVKDVQKKHHLTEDGIVGKNTLAALNDEIKAAGAALKQANATTQDKVGENHDAPQRPASATTKTQSGPEQRIA